MKWLPLSALSLLLAASSASAVSCGEHASVKQAFSTSAYVFSAFVEDLHNGPGFGRDDARLARLRVLQVWKGDLKPGDTVAASAEDSISFVSDGFVPARHSAVLVYAGGEQPFALQTCSRTASLDSATGDIPLLNKLSKKRAYAPAQ